MFKAVLHRFNEFHDETQRDREIHSLVPMPRTFHRRINSVVDRDRQIEADQSAEGLTNAICENLVAVFSSFSLSLSFQVEGQACIRDTRTRDSQAKGWGRVNSPGKFLTIGGGAATVGAFLSQNPCRGKTVPCCGLLSRPIISRGYI